MGDRTTLLVSQRGQITLPAELRRRFGLKQGGVVTLEEREGEIVLRPAAVVDIEIYSDEDIELWEREDELSDDERSRLEATLER